MKIIVGLGNPGKEYENTRHNVGFMYVDYLVSLWQAPAFTAQTKTHSLISRVDVAGESVILAKPTTFMNESGRAVAALMSYYKAPIDSLVIVHDDLDIHLGLWKLQVGKGPKGHNGIISVEQALKTTAFARLRIGVEGREDESLMVGRDYVLGKFEEAEKLMLDGIMKGMDLVT